MGWAEMFCLRGASGNACCSLQASPLAHSRPWPKSKLFLRQRGHQNRAHWPCSLGTTKTKTPRQAPGTRASCFGHTSDVVGAAGLVDPSGHLRCCHYPQPSTACICQAPGRRSTLLTQSHSATSQRSISNAVLRNIMNPWYFNFDSPASLHAVRKLHSPGHPMPFTPAHTLEIIDQTSHRAHDSLSAFSGSARERACCASSRSSSCRQRCC